VLKAEIENIRNLKRNMQLNDCFQKLTKKRGKKDKR